MVPTSRRSGSGNYEPVDAIDFDDQNDDLSYRKPRVQTTSYQNLACKEQFDGDDDNGRGHVRSRLFHYSDRPNPGLRQRLPSWTTDSLAWSQSNHSPTEPSLPPPPPQPFDRDPLIRSFSREGSTLSHPTPDLQSLQGAYTGNVLRLEESAERLSINSDLGEEVRKLHLELKRADSQRSLARVPTRQFSSSSHTDSVIGFNSVARSGGFSHEGYVTSPLSSIRSPPWSQMDHANSRDQMAAREPLQEGKPLDSRISARSNNILTVRNKDREDSIQESIQEQGVHIEYRQPEEHTTYYEPESFDDHDHFTTNLQRTASTATKSTYRQSEDAFADFDGVHIASPIDELDEQDSTSAKPETKRQSSASLLGSPPQAGKEEKPLEKNVNFSPDLPGGKEELDPLPGPEDQGMVFYPAPVPMMLKLPQKLSKNTPQAKMAQRRSEFLLPKQRSTKDLGSMFDSAETEQEEKKKLPPQLKATMFFDMPSASPSIQIQDGSAVATLESILNASAHAPVSAFTDHPIVGQSGADVYLKEKIFEAARRPVPKRSQSTPDVLESDAEAEAQGGPRKSFLGFGKKPKSKSVQISTIHHVKETDAAEASGEEASLRQSLQDEEMEEELEAHEAHLEEELRQNRPTTLLGELQMRKLEQSRRTRPAATMYPDGMRSTLLELDAVAQHQKAARKHKHVTLAWEDPQAAAQPERDDTEDVPLGMLYPTSKLKPSDMGGHWDEDRPLGLLAQRQLEDSEPLSARRARLRGDPKPTPGDRRSANLRPPSRSPVRNVEDGEDSEEISETLAQRKRRLAIKDAIPDTRPVSRDFSTELLSQWGGISAAAPEEKDAKLTVTSVTPDPDETLGQRRKRLQAEKAAAAAAASQRQANGTSGGSADVQPPAASKRTSMADLLSVHPTGHRTNRDSVQARGLMALKEQHARVQDSAPHSAAAPNLTHNQGINLAPGYYLPTQLLHGQSMAVTGQMPSNAPGQGVYVNPMTYTPMMGVNGVMNPVPAYQAMAGAGAGAGGLNSQGIPVSKGGQLDYLPLDQKRRDMIDRWRQSVM